MNYRRLFRDFKSNIVKNLCFCLLIVLSVTIIVGFNRSMDSYLTSVYAFWSNAHLEDGYFTVSEPLSNAKLKKIQNKYNCTIEEIKYANIDLSPAHSDTSLHLRVFSTQREINKVQLVDGRLPETEDEIALDPKYASTHLHQIGSIITLSNIDFKIVGYAISPDYIYTLEEPSDFLNNPYTFGVSYTTELGYKKLENRTDHVTTYSFLDPNGHLEALRDYLNDHTSLLNFIAEKDNARTITVINDVKSPKTISLIMGLLLVMIISFIISISIKNTIASESQTIGILYSQGLNKNELLRYYLMLPLLLVLIGILIGYPIGIIISKPLIAMEEVQYTIPSVTFIDTPFVFFAGIFLPLFISLTITYRSLSKALNKTPLSLLRGQHSSNKVSSFEKRFTFSRFSFFSRFRLKDMIREKTSMLSLFLGILLSMFILLTGFYLHNSVSHYIKDLEATYPYEYLYVFKSPADLDKYSKQGELMAYSDLTIRINDKDRAIGLYGIQETSTFFQIPGLSSLKNNEVLIAPCLTAKFNIQVGETIVLDNIDEDKHYPVKVVGYATDDFGQYFYTNPGGYNYITNQHKQPYNALLSHDQLNIDSDRLISLTSKSNIISSSSNLLGMISTFTVILIIVGMGILIIVTYLLMNMILEKSSINISMVKIFGYTPKEINKLYLRGNIAFPIISYLPAVPAAYLLCKAMYDSIFAEMNTYFLPYIYPSSLIIAFVLMLIGYAGACYLLKKKINKIALTEALKNRE